MTTFIKKTFIITLAVLLAFGANLLLAAGTWSAAPPSPPNNNVDAPLNVGSVTQEKSGLLKAGGLWSTAGGYIATVLGVAMIDSDFHGLVGLFNGKIGATAYCDILGAKCVTPGDLYNLASSTGSGSETPAGAVMAFDLAACPLGWSAYSAANGRNIIGTGSSGAPGAVNHVRGNATTGVGGEEKHIQTINEMAAHTHDASTNAVSAPGTYSGGSHSPNNTNFLNYPPAAYVNISSSGGSSPSNVMDPYIALLYCKKN